MAATKLLAFLFSIHILITFGQSTPSDTIALERSSQALLDKKIDFIWPGGTLAQALDALHKAQGIKFSYAGQQLDFEKTHAHTFQDASVAQVLDALLKDGRHNYMVVGRIIVIVKKKHAPVVKDSTWNHTTTPVARNSNVYTPASNLQALTWYERYMIYRNFKRELRWAEHNK
ncbi:MAG TPA: hypothetical protein VL947_00095, partial [Cytophagales bacterium]|nr:hypothetical protein [Cytophagales bacterium]